MTHPEDDDEEETGAAGEASSGKRLTPAQWAEIRSHWEVGDRTLKQLSAQYGIRIDTISRRLTKEGIKKGCRAHEVGQAVLDDARRENARISERIRETKENHYKYADMIGKLVMATVIAEAKRQKGFSGIDADLAALNKAAKTLEIVRRERYKVLGLDKEDGDPESIPELILSELQPEQIKGLQEAMRRQNAPEIDDELVLDDVVDTAIS